VPDWGGERERIVLGKKKLQKIETGKEKTRTWIQKKGKDKEGLKKRERILLP